MHNFKGLCQKNFFIRSSGPRQNLAFGKYLMLLISFWSWLSSYFLQGNPPRVISLALIFENFIASFMLFWPLWTLETPIEKHFHLSGYWRGRTVSRTFTLYRDQNAHDRLAWHEIIFMRYVCKKIENDLLQDTKRLCIIRFLVFIILFFISVHYHNLLFSGFLDSILY